MKRARDIFIGILIGCMFVATPVLAESGVKTIKAYYKDIKVMVDGEEIVSDVEPFIYEGRTFLPLRAIAEAANMSIELYDNDKTINLSSNNIFIPKMTDGKYNIIGGNPKPLSEENHFK